MEIIYIGCLYFPEASRTTRKRVLVYAIEPTAHGGERTAANLRKGATHERVTKDFGVFDLCCFFSGTHWSSRVCSAVPSAGHRAKRIAQRVKRKAKGICSVCFIGFVGFLMILVDTVPKKPYYKYT